jgi:hypothetical protein
MPVRPLDQLDRLVVAAEVVREHPQEMQRVRVVRLRFQDLPVDRLRRGESAGLMMVKGDL